MVIPAKLKGSGPFIPDLNDNIVRLACGQIGELVYVRTAVLISGSHVAAVCTEYVHHLYPEDAVLVHLEPVVTGLRRRKLIIAGHAFRASGYVEELVFGQFNCGFKACVIRQRHCEAIDRFAVAAADQDQFVRIKALQPVLRILCSPDPDLSVAPGGGALVQGEACRSGPVGTQLDFSVVHKLAVHLQRRALKNQRTAFGNREPAPLGNRKASVFIPAAILDADIDPLRKDIAVLERPGEHDVEVETDRRSETLRNCRGFQTAHRFPCTVRSEHRSLNMNLAVLASRDIGAVNSAALVLPDPAAHVQAAVADAQRSADPREVRPAVDADAAAVSNFCQAALFHDKSALSLERQFSVHRQGHILRNGDDRALIDVQIQLSRDRQTLREDIILSRVAGCLKRLNGGRFAVVIGRDGKLVCVVIIPGIGIIEIGNLAGPVIAGEDISFIRISTGTAFQEKLIRSADTAFVAVGNVNQIVPPVVHRDDVPHVGAGSGASVHRARDAVSPDIAVIKGRQIAEILKGLGVSLTDNIGAGIIVEGINQLPRVAIPQVIVIRRRCVVVADLAADIVFICYELISIANAAVAADHCLSIRNRVIDRASHVPHADRIGSAVVCIPNRSAAAVRGIGLSVRIGLCDREDIGDARYIDISDAAVTHLCGTIGVAGHHPHCFIIPIELIGQVVKQRGMDGSQRHRRLISLFSCRCPVILREALISSARKGLRRPGKIVADKIAVERYVILRKRSASCSCLGNVLFQDVVCLCLCIIQAAGRACRGHQHAASCRLCFFQLLGSIFCQKRFVCGTVVFRYIIGNAGSCQNLCHGECSLCTVSVTARSRKRHFHRYSEDLFRGFYREFLLLSFGITFGIYSIIVLSGKQQEASVLFCGDVSFIQVFVLGIDPDGCPFCRNLKDHPDRLRRLGFCRGRLLIHRLLVHGFLVHRFLACRLLAHRLLAHRFLVRRFLVRRFLVHRLLICRLLVYRLLIYRLLVYRLLVYRFLVYRFLVYRFPSLFCRCFRCALFSKG